MFFSILSATSFEVILLSIDTSVAMSFICWSFDALSLLKTSSDAAVFFKASSDERIFSSMVIVKLVWLRQQKEKRLRFDKNLLYLYKSWDKNKFKISFLPGGPNDDRPGVFLKGILDSPGGCRGMIGIWYYSLLLELDHYVKTFFTSVSECQIQSQVNVIFLKFFSVKVDVFFGFSQSNRTEPGFKV